MGNDTTVGDPQAGDPATNPQPQAGDTTTPEPQAGDEQEPISQEAAKKLRSEANALRKREKDALAQLKTYQDKEQQAQDAQLPEIERLKKQVADAESVHDGLVERMIDYEVRLQAAEMGIAPAYLKRVTQMLDVDEMEFDEASGMPTNVEKLLKELLKDMPFLAGKAQAASAGGTTNPARSSTSNAGALSWEVITAMTPAQYEARRTEIQSWMMHNPMRRY